MEYGLTHVVDELRSAGKTPPAWLKAAVLVSLIASIYLWGVMHGIQIGAAAQALGTINVPPVFIDIPFTVGGGSRFIPSATMFDILDRVRYTTMAFAGIALSGIVGWMLHTRLP